MSETTLVSEASLTVSRERFELLTASLTRREWEWLGALAAELGLGRSALASIGAESASYPPVKEDAAMRALDAWLERSIASGLVKDLGAPSRFSVSSSTLLEPTFSVHRDWAELVLRKLGETGELKDIALATEVLLDGRSVSAIALALQSGDLTRFERCFLLRRAPREPAMLSPEESLRRSVCEPFDPAWLERTWGDKAIEIGTRVLRECNGRLKPSNGLPAWLIARVIEMDSDKARAPSESALIEHAILSGKTSSIQSLGEALLPSTRLGYEAAARFVEGDLILARSLLDRSLGDPSARGSKARGAVRHGGLPECGSVAPVLALLVHARDTDEARVMAKRLIQAGTSDSERGAARAFRTLLRHLDEVDAHHRRIDVNDMPPDASAWEILLSAFTVHLYQDRETLRANWAIHLVRKADEWGSADYRFLSQQTLLLANDLHEKYAHSEIERLGMLARHDNGSNGLSTLSLWDFVTKKPEWKKALKALAEIGGGAAEREDVDIRVAWFIDMSDGSFARPLLQEYRRAGGGWSQGKRLSIAELHLRQNGLPPEDLKILACSREVSEGKRELTNEAYEMLIGHPRVMNGMRGQAAVEVVRGSCRVETEEDGGYIRLVVEPEGAKLGINVVPESDNRLVVYRVTKAMQRVMDVLPRGVRVPREHQSEVVSVLAKLAESVEVRSPELGAERVVPSDSTPCIRFSPLSGAWRVEIGVRPFGPEGRFFTAGYGRPSVTLNLNGQRLRSQRDLDLERSRADALIAACPSLVRDADDEEVHEAEGTDEWIFGEESVLSLLSELSALDLLCALEWPESQALRLRGTVNARSLRGSLRSLKGWYIAKGGVRIDDVNEVLLGDLVRAPMTAGGRFLRLPNGDYLEVEKRVRRVVAALAASSADKANRGEVRIHRGAIATLREVTKPESGFDIDTDSVEWLARVDRFSRTEFPIPSDLHCELRPYQIEGFVWLCRLSELSMGACLADDMGLGKTLQILALLLVRKNEGPTLVVAPTSVCSNWIREMERFAPSLIPIDYSGPDRAKKLASLAENKPGTVVICSYGLLQEDQPALTSVQWGTAVLDEAQFIKNAESQRARAAFLLNAKQRIAATGTPVENHFGDLWSIFHFLNPGMLGDWREFTRRFVRPIERDGNMAPQALLHDLVQPYLLRRLKRDVLPELPPVTELLHEVHLSRDHAIRYGFLRKQIHDKLFTAHGKRNNKIEVLAEITRLRRFCCHPKLVFPDADNESAKIQTFLELALELIENNHRALVFSQYVDFLRLVRDELDERQITYEYLDGSTPRRERQARVDAFQQGEKSLFVISLKAGGFGLNLTAADYVIHLDPWWNPAVEAQATDRAHRIGQERRVTVYRLVTKNTIEENIFELHRKKQKLALALLEGTAKAGSLSSDELLRMIERPGEVDEG